MTNDRLVYGLIAVSVVVLVGMFVYDRMSSVAPAEPQPVVGAPTPAPSVPVAEVEDAGIETSIPAPAADLGAVPECPWQTSQPPSREDARASERLARDAFNLLNRGQNRPAADVAARALALDGRSSRAWITLGAARESLGDRDGAEQAFRCCMSQGTGRFVPECGLMLRSP